jgi:hypothetical protein
MKRLTSLLPALLLTFSHAHAWVGGPWDNNNFEGSSASVGTYQGVISGNGITGIFMFGSSSTSNASASSTTTSRFNIFSGVSSTTTTASTAGGLGTTGNEGRAAIFVDGYLIIGQMSATADVAGRSVSGVFEGSRTRSIQTITDTFVTYSSSNSSTGASSVNNAVNNFILTDVETVSGQFNAKMDHTFPNITFSGKGTLKIKHPDDFSPITVEEIPVAPYDFGDVQNPDGAVTDSTVYGGHYYTRLKINYNGEEGNGETQPITVRGVKTAYTSPIFNNSIQIDQSSVQVK